jgi:hypothetical protein
MAVKESSKETIAFSSTPVLLNWSTLDSGANNQYVDISDADASKLVLLVASLNSSDMGSTNGDLYIGASASASSGSCWEASYVGRGTAWARMQMHLSSQATSTGTAQLQSTGGSITVWAIGPFDATRFKDSNGYIKVSKRKGSSDAGNLKICPILVP